ncbi:GntR family transcriptional regulator [Macrococcus armenti]|uniref:GntR family transcriptional regulator n=1 Tax=Macrococcus armenti TaxID=2875764 RepID=UPI001CCB4BE9|nr:GntR family transcriptional regulator [Macrococcus armenti]UBH13578.1 GntR family transcriptional regulator [Macrococcus armenti]
MISIDNRSRVPIYEQLINGFKVQIINGVLLPDEKLPSVRQLAQELTINPNTIQKAYRELEYLGYTYSVPGKGSFVNTIQNEMNKERIQMLTETLNKTVNELLFLGLTKEEIIQAIESMEGDHHDDTTE